MCWSRCWCSECSSFKSGSSSTASTSNSSRTVGERTSVELLFLLGTPIVGSLVLSFFGAGRYAPEAKAAFRFATCVLSVHVAHSGSLHFAADQFFIDPLNVFLV